MEVYGVKVSFATKVVSFVESEFRRRKSEFSRKSSELRRRVSFAAKLPRRKSPVSFINCISSFEKTQKSMGLISRKHKALELELILIHVL